MKHVKDRKLRVQKNFPLRGLVISGERGEAKICSFEGAILSSREERKSVETRMKK